MAYAIFYLIISHLIRTGMNWHIYNFLNPKSKVEFGLNHPGMLFQKDGIEKARDRDFMFMISTFTLFWIKLPQKQKEKRMAWSVLAITLSQFLIAIVIIFQNYTLADIIEGIKRMQ